MRQLLPACLYGSGFPCSEAGMSGNAFFSPLVRTVSRFVNAMNGFTKSDMLGAQLVNVIFDVLRVGGDDRAVVVVVRHP